MNQQTVFIRKIAYAVAILALLLVLYFLGFPSIKDPKNPTQILPGGVLARFKGSEADAALLSEIQLGEIDPASETIRLVSLGMRGFAAQILWQQANEYKMKKDWTNLSATLQQLAKVEPHFVNVWRFQAWNLSYNVSAEFDDYRERYRWVIKGIRFLMNGMQFNKREPMLVWDTGWYIAQKIGRADEKKQFRVLFRQDPDLTESETGGQRDNWLAGKHWFRRAEEMVDQGADLKRVTPVLFYSHAPMCQMNHADNLEADGVFGKDAKEAYKEASREWWEYGNRAIPTHDPYVTLRLNDAEPFQEEAAEIVKKLEAMEPGLREKIREERKNNLSKAERDALAVPMEKRTDRQHELAFKAEQQLRVTHEQLARRLPEKFRSEAVTLAKKADDLEARAANIMRHREIVNFNYWRRHAKVEQSDDALAARAALYEADQAMSKRADLVKAQSKFEEGFALWRKVLDANPGLVEDTSYGRDMMEVIQNYRRLLDSRDAKFPEPFILDDVVKLHKGSISE
ncbi:MAG: hypothetical protein NUV77_03360 [Thermoguttaceae bacterium]|jgi:hypothetical protein|nr:hypothetical protein [Thermoguttaceae bacterium]